MFFRSDASTVCALLVAMGTNYVLTTQLGLANLSPINIALTIIAAGVTYYKVHDFLCPAPPSSTPSSSPTHIIKPSSPETRHKARHDLLDRHNQL